MKIIRPISTQPMPEHAQKVFKGVMFDVYHWEQELYNGKKATFEKLKRADTVVIYGVLPDGKILLTEEEQPGRSPFISIPGGRIEEGEDVLEAVKRELLEETGYEAEELVLWEAVQPAGKIDWAVYSFIAKGLRKVSDINLDGGEKISLKPVTLEEFIDLGIAEASMFPEKGVMCKLFEAKLYPEKKDELKKLLGIA